MKHRAVFLDRDGVLNLTITRSGKPYAPNTLAELEIAPGAVQACIDLRAAGFLLVVVTNQPDVARGQASRFGVEQINAAIGAQVPLDDIRICYHDDVDDCDCRKPLQVMLLQDALDMEIDLSRSFMVGDRWRDIAAGQSAGCSCIFVDYQYTEKQPDPPFHGVHSLAEAAAWILGTRYP